MSKDIKQLLNSLFSQEEFIDLEKNSILLLLSKTISKVNSVLGSDAEIFNRLLVDGKSEEALKLLSDKKVNLKEIILESEKELSDSLGSKLTAVLEETKS